MSVIKPYMSENDDAFLVVFIGDDVKHGSSISRDNAVIHFSVLADIQVMGFDSAHSRAHH